VDFVGKRRWYFIFSLIIIGAGIASMLIPPGFRVGVDFTGGSALSITFDGQVPQEDVRALMTDLGYEEAVVQRLGESSYLLRTRTLEEEASQGTQGGASEREVLERALGGLAPIVTSDLASVSAVVAQETVRNAIIAVLIAGVAILLYITWAFRAMPNSLRMGTVAILATVHDVLVVVGTFSLLGKVIDLEINVAFIIGILTVLGYSVHDTIVVFDRIRENTERRVSRELATTINISILETLSRSLITSITTLLVITALLLLGGGTIQSLLVTLFVGILTGTYSSIAIASQLLVVWERGEWLGPFRRRPPAGEATPAQQG
jgi:preprotein translocase subunit SecF